MRLLGLLAWAATPGAGARAWAGKLPPPEPAEAQADRKTPDSSDATDGEDLSAAPDPRMEAFEHRLDQLERVVIQRQPRVTVSGFIDVGFFAVQGDGSGVVQDIGDEKRRHFPDDAQRYAWVFLGDLLSTAVNTRGEPADLGNPPGINRYDSISSRGAPGFIANEVNLRLRAVVADSVLATASVSFAPRRGSDFRSGDAFEVELAQLEWMIGRTRHTSIFAGKIDPVMGIEYRERKSDHRFGITPSLIARYTTGTPVGVKIRSKLGASGQVVIAAAVTNGASGIEGYVFHDDVDSNAGKTGSLRLSVAPLPGVIEIGASGEYGAQDRALDSRDALWFVGLDLSARLGPVRLKAEWLRGSGQGESARGQIYDDAHRPWGLRLNSGGYVELNLNLPIGLGALVRAEQRDARVSLGNPDAPAGGDRLYLSKSWRATLGARWAATDHLVLKLEVLRNGEYGGVPNIRNDVFTSSAVMSY